MKIKKQVGRPKLIMNEADFQEEVRKYLDNEQSGVKTYQNLKIGKTSFYNYLKENNYKRTNN